MVGYGISHEGEAALPNFLSTPHHKALSQARRKVAALLVFFYGLTYLDRICIAVAGPRMQADLHIGPAGWGWVTGIFSAAYCLFEIPAGALGDRIGARRLLTRIVVWWSSFTALTGAITNPSSLLVVRFLFGAGEAGAFPNGSIVIARWFPISQRASLFGLSLMAAQLGGALTPLLVVPLQGRYGWRASFYLLGVAGLVWAAIWHLWFRDSPEEKLGSAIIDDRPPAPLDVKRHAMPWGVALRSSNVLALLLLGFSCIYVFSFFQTWFQTFLVKGRGFSEKGLLLSAIPYLVAAACNLLGGATSDFLVRRLGTKHGRRAVGVPALAVSGACMYGVILTHNPFATVVLLSVAYGALTLQQSVGAAVCLDICHDNPGSMFGLFNTASFLSALLGSVAYGYIVEQFRNYDAPFWPMATLLLLGALLWLKVDASQKLRSDQSATLLSKSVERPLATQ